MKIIPFYGIISLLILFDKDQFYSFGLKIIRWLLIQIYNVKNKIDGVKNNDGLIQIFRFLFDYPG